MDKAREHAPRLLVSQAHVGALVPVTQLAVDTFVATASLMVAVFGREQVFPTLFGLEPFSPVRNYFSLWPALILLLAVRSLYGLYPGYGLNAAEELRRQTLATLVLAFFVLAGGAMFRFSVDYSRLVLTGTFGLLLVLLPCARALIKRLLARSRFYGEDVWIVSKTHRGEELRRVLYANAALGLRVVGVSREEPPALVSCRHCLVLPDGISNFTRMLDSLNGRFRRVWLVPDMLDVSSVWITPRDLHGHLALELRNNLLEPLNRTIKRSLELLVLALSLPLVAPLTILLSTAIALESGGPVLFRQRRIGRGGRSFEILKFRTMRLNADACLREHLENDSSAAAEWNERKKLRHDPRLTRVGKLLRRLSLDELPQLWNVAQGEMSLVGPRAIVTEELELYGPRAHLYTAVSPGLTGLWQVSGRSRLSYDDRVRLDSYYVRNWSVWLDLAILAKTPWAVLAADGAY